MQIAWYRRQCWFVSLCRSNDKLSHTTHTHPHALAHISLHRQTTHSSTHYAWQTCYTPASHRQANLQASTKAENFKVRTRRKHHAQHSPIVVLRFIADKQLTQSEFDSAFSSSMMSCFNSRNTSDINGRSSGSLLQQRCMSKRYSCGQSAGMGGRKLFSCQRTSSSWAPTSKAGERAKIS